MVYSAEQVQEMLDDQKREFQAQQSSQFPAFPPTQVIDDVTLVTQTNPRPLIEHLLHVLRCEVETPNGKGGTEWKRPQGRRPLLNEDGIHSILADVYPVVNQSTILSNLDEEDVSKTVIELGKTVTLKLMRNWKEFECDKANLTTIVFSVTNMAYTALKRGLGQGERNFLKTSVRTTENVLYRPKSLEPEKKPAWQFWK